MKRSRLVVAGALASLALAGAALPSADATVRVASPAAASVVASRAGAVKGATLLTDTLTSNNHVPSACTYPPTRQPKITLVASPTSVRGTAKFTLSGTLYVNSITGCPLKNWPVYLYSNNKPNGTFYAIAVTTTNGNGAYSFANRQISATTYFVTQSVPGGTYFSAQSPVVQVSWSR